MARRVLPGIRPTRIELLKLKKREILAKKAHNLLEEKLDAMVGEFLSVVEEYHGLRETVEGELSAAYGDLVKARMVMGTTGVEDTTLSIEEIVEIPMDVRRIMGVRVPLVHVPPSLRRRRERGYGFIGTSVALDEAADAFEAALRNLLFLAEKEVTLRRLGIEIEKTRRRVKALENILIPRLRDTQKYIEMHLEEQAREDLFRRKMTKVLLKERYG